MKTKYAHINIIAKDWKFLCEFYQEIFECVPISTERDHHGESIDLLTGISKVRVKGRHLRVPGYGENAPTIEIFSFNQGGKNYPKTLNRPGFSHLAFEVDDLDQRREKIKEFGGSDYGEKVVLDISGAGKLTLIYMTDPEGNIIELQKWH
jgi:predicted enzyme related to lactoylglutathione lyase